MPVEWQLKDERSPRPLAHLKNYALEREQQVVAQRRLREHLRYRGYVRAGTLSDWMQRWHNRLLSFAAWFFE